MNLRHEIDQAHLQPAKLIEHETLIGNPGYPQRIVELPGERGRGDLLHRRECFARIALEVIEALLRARDVRREIGGA